jgi:hypothetical protein
MKTVVVSNCTGRKRKGDNAPLVLSWSAGQRIEHVAQGWIQSLRTMTPTMPIDQLYVGRSVAEVRAVRETVAGRTMFVSAGLGLVDEAEWWPPYNLTTSKGEGSISPFLESRNADTQAWWEAINGARDQIAPLRSLLHSDVDLVLLALPSGYLEMVSLDLDGASNEALGKLRIFTSRSGSTVLPLRVQSSVMPYDDRLEAELPGTRTDFPQRAMRHFVEVLEGHRENIQIGRSMVTAGLARSAMPKLPARVKATDGEILSLLKQHWDTQCGHSSKLLRCLRDEALVACEQRRFRDLWREAKAQLQQGVSHG